MTPHARSHALLTGNGAGPARSAVYDQTLRLARVVILFCSISCTLSLACASREGPCAFSTALLSEQPECGWR
jgi:hypothetical protein